MSPFVRFIVRRLLHIPFSLFIITLVLYGGVMLTPPEARAQLYIPPNPKKITENYINSLIRDNHLDEPYLVQYTRWIKSLATGSWGYSPTLHEEVLPSLLRRTPITLELAIYSFLLFVPLGLAAGLLAGWKPESRFDNSFRSLAFFGTSVPPFILALAIMGVFYVNLGWFAPGRISYQFGRQILEEGYKSPTGFLTIDALINGRFDILLDALKHLAMPVVALALYHWATLGRIMRATAIGERAKDYIVAAKARGVSEKRLVWKHGFRASLIPPLTSIALSATSIVTGVFVIEMIYGIKGVSEVLVSSMLAEPDAPAALGFAIYSVIMVISLMVVLDIVQAVLDPRVREELSK